MIKNKLNPMKKAQKMKEASKLPDKMLKGEGKGKNNKRKH